MLSRDIVGKTDLDIAFKPCLNFMFKCLVQLVLNPLPDMPILFSSNSAANKDMIYMDMDKWG